ncbi:MAG: MATE family efflux transporter [Bacteroidales bacterium]|nr:MATE family efflux transporter [Bacteroidales bacterium]MDD2322188.1 MATE family efflux transporter [Bacteroidales bacterium]MDD3960896.1 MATE family efflux transporter [Bacteroidales bacterium]MDY0285258.1 MATE family efflux transporter [Bacteroidales bacterium]HPE86911.1 MATE family efflux transporter [Bacteroidales bacterium]
MGQLKVSNKKIWNLAYPIILGGIAQNIVLATDTAFLGRLGEVALGAAALGGLFYYIAFFVANGIGVGAQIIMSRRFGEKNYALIGAVMAQTGILMAGFTLLLFVFMYLFSGAFFSMSINSEEVRNATHAFLTYRSWGIFFAGINVLMRAFFISIHRTRVITYTTVLIGMVNVTLDYALIFGHFGLPQMGVEGAALASVISEASASLFLIVYIQVMIPSKRYNLRFTLKPELVRLGRIMKTSTPVMLQNFLSMAGWFIFFLFVEHLGEAQLAVSNIIRSIYMVLLIPVFGFASAAATLVSYLMGSESTDQVFSLLRKVVVMVILSVAVILIPVILFQHSFLRFYTVSPELIELAHGPLRVIFGTVFLYAVGFTLFHGVSGTGNTLVSLLIEGSVLILYLVTVWLFVFVFHFSVTLVWLAEFVYAVFLGLISYVYLKMGHWQDKIV